jgi:hypothetical protein
LQIETGRQFEIFNLQFAIFPLSKRLKTYKQCQSTLFPFRTLPGAVPFAAGCWRGSIDTPDRCRGGEIAIPTPSG